VAQRPDSGTHFAYLTSLERDQAVATLAGAYKDRPITIISLIYSRPAEKMRILADAFRI
jgi:hypothetical protein